MMFAEAVAGDALSPIIILREALDQVAKATTLHTVKEIIEKDSKKIVDKYLMRDSDGAEFERTEITTIRKGKDPIKTITITNGEGIWFLIDNKVLLLKDEAARLNDINKIDPEGLLKKTAVDEKNKYTIKEIIYHDKMCYKISMILSEKNYETRLKLGKQIDEEVYKKMDQKSSSKGSPQAKANDLKANDFVPQIYEYVIDKETMHIYSDDKYNAKGDRIRGNAYNKVEMNIPLSKDLFLVPQNMKKYIVNSSDDFVQAITNKK